MGIFICSGTCDSYNVKLLISFQIGQFHMKILNFAFKSSFIYQVCMHFIINVRNQCAVLLKKVSFVDTEFVIDFYPFWMI